MLRRDAAERISKLCMIALEYFLLHFDRRHRGCVCFLECGGMLDLVFGLSEGGVAAVIWLMNGGGYGHDGQIFGISAGFQTLWWRLGWGLGWVLSIEFVEPCDSKILL
jgi:hypothetical protein